MKYIPNHQKNYSTTKTDVCHIDDIWSSDISDSKDYGSENNRGYRYVLVVIDNFTKFGWTFPLRNKKAQSITNSVEKVLISSERMPSLIETDRGKEFYNNFPQSFIINNTIKFYSRNTSLGAALAETFK